MEMIERMEMLERMKMLEDAEDGIGENGNDLRMQASRRKVRAKKG
jgi:hypothetical protein